MSNGDIDAALDRAEASLASGGTLKGTGFWRAVDAARRDRALAERYADRMAAIDRRAFEKGVRLRVPVSVGVGALAVVTAFGILAIAASSTSRPSCVPGAPCLLARISPAWAIVFLIGAAAVIVGTHSLTHFIVGRLSGIRFTHVFLGGPPPPRPGMKTDYATYLRATPMKRAVMHASGAVVTKVVPFALVPLAWSWLVWVLLAIGVVQIITDVTLSTKVSDWMKVKRELRSRS